MQLEARVEDALRAIFEPEPRGGSGSGNDAPRDGPARPAPLAGATALASGDEQDAYGNLLQAVVRSHAGLLRHLVTRIGPVAPEFRVINYRCGPGRRAIETVRPVVEAYRGLSRSGYIAVCHADEADNDWSDLLAEACGPKGYAYGDPFVRRVASVGHLQHRFQTPGACSLGICFAATHKLSRAVPVVSPGTVAAHELAGRARAELAARAEADWAGFLRFRAEELHSRGYLLHCGFASPDGRDRTSAAGMLRAIQTVAGKMAEEGLLNRRALDSFVLPHCYRSAEELRRPLESEPDLKRQFEEVSLTVAPLTADEDDIFAPLLGDPRRYGSHYAGLLRDFAFRPLNNRLFRPSADCEAEAERLAETFFRRIAKLYAEAPEAYAANFWISTLVLRRR